MQDNTAKIIATAVVSVATIMGAVVLFLHSLDAGAFAVLAGVPTLSGVLVGVNKVAQVQEAVDSAHDKLNSLANGELVAKVQQGVEAALQSRYGTYTPAEPDNPPPVTK